MSTKSTFFYILKKIARNLQCRCVVVMMRSLLLLWNWEYVVLALFFLLSNHNMSFVSRNLLASSPYNIFLASINKNKSGVFVGDTINTLQHSDHGPRTIQHTIELIIWALAQTIAHLATIVCESNFGALCKSSHE